MRETTLGIDTPAHTLAATLAEPDHPPYKGVIVMFAGSGPIDRNENLPNFALNIFNQLAEAFAVAGYASLRYDKRGCGASGGNYLTAGHNDFVSDAVTVTDYVKNQSHLKALPLVLLGHSEGCAIAPQVANQTAVQALIALCPFTQPMRDVLLQQALNQKTEMQTMTGLSGYLTRLIVALRGGHERIQQKFLKRIEASKTDTLAFGKTPVNAKWFREMLALDVAALWRSVSVPTFALGGGKDVQCSGKDTLALHSLITNAPVTTHIEPDLTHILRCDTAPAGTRRYVKLIEKPVANVVEQRCVDWLDATIIT